MDLLQEQRIVVPNIGKLSKLSKNDINRILSKINVKVLKKDECWIWNGTIKYKRKGHQHGNLHVNGKDVLVHRIMYHNFIEDVPIYIHSQKNLIVLHKCSHLNNGKCINPWHMKLGTEKENTWDAMKDNTLTLLKSNEKNPQSKLSNTKIKEIIALKNSGRTQYDISREYGINQSQVSRYWNKITRKQT